MIKKHRAIYIIQIRWFKILFHKSTHKSNQTNLFSLRFMHAVFINQGIKDARQDVS